MKTLTEKQIKTLENDIDSMPPDCPAHPHFLGDYKPRMDCAPCWATYNWVNCTYCTNETLCGMHRVTA